MLNNRHLERYADVLLWGLKTARRGRFRKGDVILIQYDHAALKLAEILFDRIIAAGMNPVQRMGLTIGMERSFYGKSGQRQLTFQAPGEKEFLGNLHGRIYLHAPESLTHLKEIDPARIGKVLVARKPLRDILERREQEGLHGWTLCTLPTQELATQARTTPEALRRADHPGLLSRPARSGRQMESHPARGDCHQAMAGRHEDALLPCRIRKL